MNNSSKIDELQERSEPVREILGKTPKWIVSWGTTIILCVISILLSASFFIKYPDVINTQVNITFANPPVRIMAQTSGKVQDLYVKDNDTVQSGQPLAILDNPANTADVLYLRQLTATIDSSWNLPQVLAGMELSHNVQAGELQSTYSLLYQAINNYKFFTARNSYHDRVQNLQEQVSHHQELGKELTRRDQLLKEQLQLEEKRAAVNEMLAKEKVIAPLEYEAIRKNLLNQQVTTEGNRITILQNTLEKNDFSRNISELQDQYRNQENDRLIAIKEATKRLRGELAVWEQRYLIKAPVAGTVTLFRVWSRNQYISSGTPVMMISPAAQAYKARAFMPVKGAGKVKKGQQVLIKLNAYPYEEFGILHGYVDNISNVAMDSSYALSLRLPNGLVTNADKPIQSQPELTGIGEILTENKSIMDRVFENLWGKVRK